MSYPGGALKSMIRNKDTNESRLISRYEAAKALGVHYATVDRLIA